MPPHEPRPIPNTPAEDLLINIHARLRDDVEELEELISGTKRFTYPELKRLDKSATLLKIGCKYIKFVFKGRGFRKSSGKQDILVNE